MHEARIKNAIDQVFLKQLGQSLETLIDALKRAGINTVLRQNEKGIVYGLSYVDHQTKCVFNGSELGKPYSAQGLRGRCVDPIYSAGHSKLQVYDLPMRTIAANNQNIPTFHGNPINEQALIEVPLHADQTSAYVPHQLVRKRRKKSTRALHLSSR